MVHMHFFISLYFFLQTTLDGVSQYLFSALDGRAYLRSTTVLLPPSWPDSCAPKTVTGGAGDAQDITVVPQGPFRGRAWTQQSIGCGQPADQIYLTYQSLVKKDDTLGECSS